MPERRVYQDGVEELLRVLNVDDRLHLGEDAERVALLEQIGELAVLPPPQQHQRHVVNHVAVRDVVEEGGERLRRLRLQEVELLDQLLLWRVGEGWVRGGKGEAGAREGAAARRTVHFSARVVVLMGEGSFCKKLP